MTGAGDGPVRILVGVSGGIAAYKTCTLVSRLVQRGADVHVIMSEAATKLVGPATFRALTGNDVITDLWRPGESGSIPHTDLTAGADLMVTAPATADLLARAAHGLADDALATTLLAAPRPAVYAPAMNPRMWSNPAVQANVDTLRERGEILVGPGDGWVACRESGPGRMSEPDDILEAVLAALADRGRPLGD